MSLSIEGSPIVGKVIRILDESTIMLDVGSNDGVKLGNKFAVFDEGEEIIDPTTKLSLGKYEYIKAIVEITKVQEKFSEAQDLERETLSPLEQTIKSLKGGIIITAKKLPVDKDDVKPLPHAPEKRIKVGDKARRISW